MYGIKTIDDILFIDIIILFQKYKVVNNIIDILCESALNKKTIIISVGKSITISSIEKHYKFIKEIAKMFYSIENITIEKCYICNTPQSFSTIFAFIKPILSTDTLKKIHFERDNNKFINL